jgi:hypothetical protein
MGVPIDTMGRPLSMWTAARRVKAKVWRHLILLMAILAIVLFLLLGDIIVNLMGYDRYRSAELDVCCYSVLTGLAIVFGFIALRTYRRFLALSIADDPVYRTFTVKDRGEMVDVVDNGLKALHMDVTRFDPPGPAYTDRERFPKSIQGMFRVRDPDLAIVVHTGSKRTDGFYRSDVIIGPVNEGNRTEVARVLQAIDERWTSGRPALNIATAGSDRGDGYLGGA